MIIGKTCVYFASEKVSAISIFICIILIYLEGAIYIYVR